MKTDKKPKEIKLKLKRGDKVVVIAGKDKGREGKILLVDRQRNRVIVEGINMVSRHQKAKGHIQQSGIVKKEAFINASNVMFLHKGKPTRIGYKVERKEQGGKMVNVKYRIAKKTGELID